MTLFLASVLLSGPMTGPETLTLELSKPKCVVERTLFGAFFEEINQAGEGGLYGELLMNRALALRDKPLPHGWEARGEHVSFDRTVKLHPNAAGSLHLKAEASPSIAANYGFWGIPATEKQQMTARIWAKGHGRITVALVNIDGREMTTSSVVVGKEQWSELSTTLIPPYSDTGARLEFRAEPGSDVWIGYCSLMRSQSWKNRANGLRPDLAERLAAFQPGFLRFPGGCYVEGNSLSNCFDWRATLQPIQLRPPTPYIFWGYVSSNGLGYHEYLQLCEDLKAAPLFVINCGMSHSEIVPMDQMKSRVQDALDAIEYANGSVKTKMGALRAKNGHPKPFNLKFVEIGNENGYSWSFGGPAPYYERFKLINDAIRAKFPEVKTISNVTVPNPGDMVSEHYYDSPLWFWKNKDRYDAYKRSGPRIYVGEYAVTQQNGRGSLAGALGEAAFMTGMERNADVVAMCSYAPLFENVHNRQWNPNAIVFDNSRSYGTPSYWVQHMFGNNRIDVAVNSTLQAQAVSKAEVSGGFGFRTWNTKCEFKDIKVEVNGKALYDSTAAKIQDLDVVSGAWKADQDSLSQSELEPDRVAVIKGISAGPSDDWKFEYSARAVDGVEGFIGLFGYKDRRQSVQLNIGGWGNTGTAFERDGSVVEALKPVTIVKGKWYRVRIVKRGEVVSAFIDDAPFGELRESAQTLLAASTGVDLASKELVVKLVNGAEVERTIELQGVPNTGKPWKSLSMTASSLTAENTLNYPKNVVPIANTIPAGTAVKVGPRTLLIVRIPLTKAELAPAAALKAKGS
ncbi:MAG: hypothetical protein JST40_05240 [Armatimonadetes bacterium]|nr:hypothetical protein [Armatimonadota bacterium]